MENKQIYPPKYDGMYSRRKSCAFSEKVLSVDVAFYEEAICDLFSKQKVSGSVLFSEDLDKISQKRTKWHTSAENLEKVTFQSNQDAIYPVSNTINQARGFVGLSNLSESKGVKDASAHVISNGDEMISCTALFLNKGTDIEEPDMVHHKHIYALPYEQLRDLNDYAKQVEPTRTGAMTHPGGKEEVVCYADI